MKPRVIIREVLLFGAMLCLFIACVPLFQGIQSRFDLEAPIIRELQQIDNQQIRILFSENVRADLVNFTVHGGGSIDSLLVSDSETIELTLSGCDISGNEYLLEGTVTDKSGNSLWFMQPFYGVNSNLARLIITEFINENSSSRFEKVELFVLKEGNLGGITVYNGAAINNKASITFQEQEVIQGEYLIVHFRSKNLNDSGEVNEYGNYSDAILNGATSNQAIDGTRDFWAEGENGLSDTNGAISVYHTPAAHAKIMDAVAYSNRTFEEGKAHGSFGTSYTWGLMQELHSTKAWTSAYGNIRPEDCLRTENSTSTRSLNRKNTTTDNNGPEDWYIVATGESSFGLVNSNIRYEP